MGELMDGMLSVIGSGVQAAWMVEAVGGVDRGADMSAFVPGAAAGPSRRCRVARKCSTRAVEYVTCDVDGTLLNSAHNVSPADADAVTRTLRRGVKFVTATGKSRQGSLNSIGPDLEKEIRTAYDGNVPGVFLQGIIVYGLDGKIVYERALDEAIIRKVSVPKPVDAAGPYGERRRLRDLTRELGRAGGQSVPGPRADVGSVQRRPHPV